MEQKTAEFINVKRLARIVRNWQNKHITKEQRDIWKEEAEEIIGDYLPHGSGFDAGCKFDYDRSKPNELLFEFSYHHMEDGYYIGWTNHRLAITPSLANDFDMKITTYAKSELSKELRDAAKESEDYFYDVFGAIFYIDQEG